MAYRIALLAVLLAAVAAPVATSAPLNSAPPLAALRTLPAPPKLPADYVRAVGRIATHAGISRATAVARTRLLLSDVTGLPLYAFGGANGQVCFVVWRGLGTCGTLGSDRHAIWGINGGSHKRGQAVVGVVSDAVGHVTVFLDGKAVPARLRNNAFVAPFRLAKNQPMPRVAVHTATR